MYTSFCLLDKALVNTESHGKLRRAKHLDCRRPPCPTVDPRDPGAAGGMSSLGEEGAETSTLTGPEDRSPKIPPHGRDTWLTSLPGTPFHIKSRMTACYTNQRVSMRELS